MKRAIKGLAIVAGGLAAVLLVAALVITKVAAAKSMQHFDIAVQPVSVPDDAEAIARGRHLYHVVAHCTECHGEDLGGKVMADDPAFGTLAGPNLTSGKGGIGRARSDLDLVRAIRHAVAPDGQGLWIMPSESFYYFSDEDLGAIIAFIRAAPPVDRELPQKSLGPIARTLVATGKMQLVPAAIIDHTAPRDTPPAAADARYGAYLGHAAGCVGCHGPTLKGGPVLGAPPDWPPAANLTKAALGSWTFADFERAMRTGKRPDGRELNRVMPWQAYVDMTEQELQALWAFLQTKDGL